MELLLAMAITAIVLTIVNTTFFRSHRQMQQVRAETDVYQMVRMSFDRMVRDLSCAYVPSRDGGIPEDDLILYRFTGKDEQDGETHLDTLSCTTTTELGFTQMRGMLCEVSYYLKEMDDVEDRYVLVRREDCTPHRSTGETGVAMELMENVTGMEIVYVDEEGREAESWDLSEKMRLPRQIKITLTVHTDQGELEFAGVASPPLAGVKLKLAKEQQDEG